MSSQLEVIKNKKIRQSNDFIESPYAQEFTAHEIKIFEVGAAGIHSDDVENANQRLNKRYSLTSNQLANLLNTSVSVISHEIENTAKRIMRKTIHLRKTLDDGTVEFEMINIIPYAKYKNGTFEFDLNYAIIPYLVEINKNFTEYQLHYLLALKSSYAIKIYKLLYQYKNIKSRVFKVDDLKEQCGVASKYPQYKNFKQRILLPSVEQINKITDLCVSFVEIKVGRSVEKIEFTFEVKKPALVTKIQNSEKITDISSIPSNLDKLLTSIEEELSSSTKDFVLQYYKEKGIDYVEVSIQYARAHATKNFDKYLCDTLSKGWAEAQVKKVIVAKNKKQKELIKTQQVQEKKQHEEQQAQANKSLIEHEWHKLRDADKVHYVKHANYIMNKHNVKLSGFNAIEETLPICVYAISNEKSYNYNLELYIKNVLNSSLNIYDVTS